MKTIEFLSSGPVVDEVRIDGERCDQVIEAKLRVTSMTPTSLFLDIWSDGVEMKFENVLVTVRPHPRIPKAG